MSRTNHADCATCADALAATVTIEGVSSSRYATVLEIIARYTDSTVRV